MLHDLGLMIIEWSPSLVLSGRAIRPAYNSDDVQAYWDVLVFADREEVRCNRVDTQIADNKTIIIITNTTNNNENIRSKPLNFHVFIHAYSLQLQTDSGRR